SCEIAGGPGQISRTLIAHAAAATGTSLPGLRDDGRIMVPALTKLNMGHLPPRSLEGWNPP
ncbi:MAG: hypothetical protein KAI98_02770, partial [Gemmatimonadetes bacterium]|nr:hypothetical protein [Gemmatimonadota bacterium]